MKMEEKFCKVFSYVLFRYQSFAFWIAVCILRGSSSTQDRVEILNVFIKVSGDVALLKFVQQIPETTLCMTSMATGYKPPDFHQLIVSI